MVNTSLATMSLPWRSFTAELNIISISRQVSYLPLRPSAVWLGYPMNIVGVGDFGSTKQK